MQIKKSLSASLLVLMFATMLYSCKKGDLASSATAVKTPTLDTAKTVVTTPVTTSPTVVIGTGSGDLILKDQTGKNFTIAPGTYTSFQFSNIKNCTINGLNTAKVVGGAVYLDVVNGLTLNNFSVSNSTYRAFQINTQANDLTIKDVQISNIGDVCMVFNINKTYDGTAASYSNNIQLINVKADNVSTFFAASGNITSTGFTGLIKNFRMQGCTITNSPNLTDGVYLGCAEDYVISDNVINNVNTVSNIHNGIFHLLGNGKVYNNKCTNHQGNLVRAWLFSITHTGLVEIYNNVVWNSTRYGAFELQVPPYIQALSTFKPANAKVYSNTVGKLNTGLPQYFQGRLLDLYETMGTVEINNNLYFNDTDNILINNMSDTKITVNTNNVYKNTAAEAVTDLTSFTSLVPGVGKQ